MSQSKGFDMSKVSTAGKILIIASAALAFTTLPLWGLLCLMSVFALGLGTTFPVSARRSVWRRRRQGRRRRARRRP